MKTIKKLCIITPRYPNAIDVSTMPFVRQFAWTIADTGVAVNVICPLFINSGFKALKHPKVIEETTDSGSKLSVHFPKCINFGQKPLGPLRLGEITLRFFHRAVQKTLNMTDKKPDALYGHFINPAGISAGRLGKKMKIAAFLGYGESYFWAKDGLAMNTIREGIANMDGVIAVSSNNKKIFDEYHFLKSEKVRVFPNGIREELYFPRNKQEAREKLGLPQDAFIICFVGHFNQRKGLDTLNTALTKLEGVHTVFAGKGAMTPEPKNNLFTGALPSEQMPNLYSASDAFVLPTWNEGLSNAIVEAMACGLPIISTNLPFNDDILDESNSIRIAPGDADALAAAISVLRDKPEVRTRLAEGSLKRASSLTLKARARNILDFMAEMSGKAE